VIGFVSREIVVGEILGAFGVRGWIKVQSHTDPPENILKYSPWLINKDGAAWEGKVIEGRRHGHAVVARLEGIADRDQAALLRKCAISVPRDRFPPLKRGQYYWADLIGLEVRAQTGLVLGKVVNMIETGANDVMEVGGDRQRLIPFVTGEFVKEVRLDEGVMVVDWDPDF
jgi:16S rRNA processing protein RimM